MLSRDVNPARGLRTSVFLLHVLLAAASSRLLAETPTNPSSGQPAERPTDAAPPSMVSLEDVWATVLSVDYRKQASERMVLSAAETLNYARAHNKPEVVVEGGYTVNDRVAGTRLELGPGIEATVPVLQRNFYFLRTGVLIPIYTGGRIGNGVEVARAGVSIAAAEKDRTLLDIKIGAAEIYLNVLKAKRFVELAGKNMETLKAHGVDVERLQREGMLARNDVLAMRVAISGARQKEIKARNALLLAGAAYHRLMHHESRESMNEAIHLQEVEPDTSEVDLDTALAAAQVHRPELLILREQMKALGLQAKIQKETDLPQAAISGGYNAIQDRYLSHQDLWSVSVGFRWKLYDGGKSGYEAKALEEKAAALKNIMEEASTGIALQVRQAWLNRNEARERIAAAREGIEQAEENARITRHRFLQGLCTNTELLDAETLLDQGYASYENARYDAVLADLLLKKAEGTL